MNVDISSSVAAGRGTSTTANSKLSETCRDVEGIFLSMLMKEGLKSMIEGDEESGSHASAMLENTIEQVASQMADTRSFGIANMLYEQVSGAAGIRKGNKP